MKSTSEGSAAAKTRCPSGKDQLKSLKGTFPISVFDLPRAKFCLSAPVFVSNFQPSSPADSKTSFSFARHVWCDENTWAETAHISSGESQSWGHYCWWSRARVQVLAVWSQQKGSLHTLPAGRSLIPEVLLLISGQRRDPACVMCLFPAGKSEEAARQHPQASQREEGPCRKGDR